MASLARRLPAGAMLAAAACAAAACSTASTPTAPASPVPPPAWGRAVTVALPPQADPAFPASLAGVGCAPRGFCVAGGGYRLHDFALRPMTATWSGGRWRRARALPFPAGLLRGRAAATVTSVSCVSSVSCAAVGIYQSGNGTTEGFTATMSGGRWSPARVLALPAGAGSPAIASPSVACAGPGECVAVGAQDYQTGIDRGFAAAEKGGAWGRATWLRPPAKADRGYFDPLGVACPAPGRCVTVGQFESQARGLLPAETAESGGVWAQARPLPLPPSAGSHPFSGAVSVSCSAAGQCLAIGHYGFNGAMFATAETGGVWQPGRAVVPAGPRLHGHVLRSVSCPAPGACVAAGSVFGSAAMGQPLVATWSGARWRLAALTAPAAAAAGSALMSVSCWSARHCVAVGFYARSRSLYLPMAAVSR